MKLKDFLFEAGTLLLDLVMFMTVPFLVVMLFVHFFLLAVIVLAKLFTRIVKFVYDCSEKILTVWLGYFEGMVEEDE